jgi:hypothetical protein
MGMTILGDAKYIPHPEFCKKIEEAIHLLNTKAKKHYAELYKNTYQIKANAKTGADYTRANIDVARRTFDSSVTWLASVLVHEGHHLVQFKNGQQFTGVEAELESNKIQLEVLRLIGAPQSEITHLLSQDGKHFDLNGDGKYDEKDYKLRNY